MTKADEAVQKLILEARSTVRVAFDVLTDVNKDLVRLEMALLKTQDAVGMAQTAADTVRKDQMDALKGEQS